MTLIGCMAAWNEAELIGGAIESLWAIGCNRVIVVDGQWNGFSPDEPYYSTDGTQNIAASLGAEVIDAPGRAWHNQVEARNAYLVGKPGDWYLVCDADERCHGTLPTLNNDSNAYWVQVKGAGGGPLSGTRLFRHAGQRIEYYQRHYLLYVDGAALALPTLTAYAFAIEGVDRNDFGRDALKGAYYPQATIAERGGDPEHPQPILKKIPVQPLGPVRYIGNGSWIPGIPASDMDAYETMLHHDGIVANINSARPIYELVNPPTAPKPPAQIKTRRNRRKEK